MGIYEEVNNSILGLIWQCVNFKIAIEDKYFLKLDGADRQRLRQNWLVTPTKACLFEQP